MMFDFSDMEKSYAWTEAVDFGQGVTFGEKRIQWELIALAAAAGVLLLYLMKKAR